MKTCETKSEMTEIQKQTNKERGVNEEEVKDVCGNVLENNE